MAQEGLAHAIVSDFLRVAAELGTTPSRDKYCGTSDQPPLGKYPKDVIRETFGNWTALVRASGLEYAAKGKRDKQEIRAQVFEHVQKEASERKAKAQPPELIKRLICVSDLHKPYGHPDTNDFLAALQEKYNFTHVLIGGDEIDAHATSFHTHDPNLLSPGHELEIAIKQLKPLYKLFPKAFVLSSNHGDLFIRKAKHFGIPAQVLRSYNEILDAPSTWEWREHWVLQFTNGKKAYAAHGIGKNYLQMGQNLGMCFIQFHFHNELGIRYWSVNSETHWAIQSGCFVDDTSLAMAYNKATLGRPVIGCSGVIDGLPVLFPMCLDANGRWNKTVP